jgi:feruloyl esterase
VGKLRCANGADTGDTCLSDKQIAADRFVHGPYEHAPLKNGVTRFRATITRASISRAVWKTTSPATPRRFPITSEDDQSGGWVNADGFVRYMFVRDAKFDSLKFKEQDYAKRIREISDMFDTTDPDLSAFLNRGGN